MRDAIDWNAVEAAYLELQPERDTLPFRRGEISSRLLDPEPLDSESAEAYKGGITLFFLLAVQESLSDHLLTSAEIEDLETARLILRIREGDLVKFHEQRIRSLLCREIQLLLEDLEVTPLESLHKVKLQRVLGLGYDAFSALVGKEVERIIANLLPVLGVHALADLDAEGLNWIRSRLNALDLVFKIGRQTHVPSLQNFPEDWPAELRS